MLQNISCVVVDLLSYFVGNVFKALATHLDYFGFINNVLDLIRFWQKGIGHNINIRWTNDRGAMTAMEQCAFCKFRTEG